MKSYPCQFSNSAFHQVLIKLIDYGLVIPSVHQATGGSEPRLLVLHFLLHCRSSRVYVTSESRFQGCTVGSTLTLQTWQPIYLHLDPICFGWRRSGSGATCYWDPALSLRVSSLPAGFGCHIPAASGPGSIQPIPGSMNTQCPCSRLRLLEISSTTSTVRCTPSRDLLYRQETSSRPPCSRT